MTAHAAPAGTAETLYAMHCRRFSRTTDAISASPSPNAAAAAIHAKRGWAIETTATTGSADARQMFDRSWLCVSARANAAVVEAPLIVRTNCAAANQSMMLAELRYRSPNTSVTMDPPATINGTAIICPIQVSKM